MTSELESRFYVVKVTNGGKRLQSLELVSDLLVNSVAFSAPRLFRPADADAAGGDGETHAAAALLKMQSARTPGAFDRRRLPSGFLCSGAFARFA